MAAESIYVDGVLQKTTTLNRSFSSPKWINVDNSYGYVMLSDSPIDIKRTENNTDTFLTLSIDHGEAPFAGQYAYVMLPGATGEETESFSSAPEVSVISMNSDMHAVRDNETGAVAANIFTSGQTIEGFTFYAPCSIIITEGSEGEYVLNISDPTLTLAGMKIGVSENVTVSGNSDVSFSNGGILVKFMKKGSTCSFSVSK